MSNTTCPIWGTPSIEELTERDGRLMDSPRAGGKYFVMGSAEAKLASPTDYDNCLRVRLTSWLVEQRRLGVSCPEISSTTLDDVTKRHPLSVHDRADAFLRYLGAKSDLLGTVVKFYAMDNAKALSTAHELLAWTASRKMSEVVTLVEYCNEDGWIEHRPTERTGSSQNTVHELMLRPPGYARLAKLSGINSGSKQAFVAMWFDESMKAVYEEGIEPAIRESGYEALRIDGKEHINKIDDEIIAEIRRSRFLVADFTQGDSGARGGVYYEAGFARGLNIPVIFTCREDAICKVHFDTRQFNHIKWKSPEELRGNLRNRITAVIGDGPLLN